MRYVPGFRTYLPPQIQWQPTTTAHDPNPPITIDEAGGSIEDRTFTIAGAATVSFNAESTVDRTFTIAGAAAVSFNAESINDQAFSIAGAATVSFSIENATPVDDAPLVLGGWAWPSGEGERKKKRKHREPFEGLRDQIEAIARRMRGSLEGEPPELVTAARAVADVVEPFVSENRIDWKAALRRQKFAYELETATAAYEQALRQAIEDQEDEEFLLLAAA